jgi:hypothetical protein
MKNNTFYKVDYIPNKLVFIYSIDKLEIRFLAFFKESGKDFNAVSHSISSLNKKDFKPVLNCFKPEGKIKELINQKLVFQLN